MGDAGLEEDEATTHECWRGCKDEEKFLASLGTTGVF